MTQQTRQLGHSGPEVSVLGVGCNAFGARTDEAEVRAIVDAAIDHGVSFFDTADTYALGGSETLLGLAVAGRRDQVVIATKFGMDMQGANGDDHGRRGASSYVRTAVEASLRRLGTDYIDLYQLHTPDPQTPIEETLGALTELIDAGLVRSVGCSNFQAWQLVDADWRARTGDLARFTSAQNEYSLYNPLAETELAPAAAQLDVAILPYFPLAYGLLTGKYRRDEDAPLGSRLAAQSHRLKGADWPRIDALQGIADEAGVSLLDVAIGGLADRPGVGSVIAGISRPEQVAQNVSAAQWRPDAAARDAIDRLVAPAMSYTTYAPR